MTIILGLWSDDRIGWQSWRTHDHLLIRQFIWSLDRIW